MSTMSIAGPVREQTAGWVREQIAYRHYLVAQVMDMWTDNFALIGTRTTGEATADCLIVSPGWHGTAPAGIDATYRCDTRYAWVLVQIAADDSRDFPEVHALQDGLKITPLSAPGARTTRPQPKSRSTRPRTPPQPRLTRSG
jgi:hypothetical protein